MSAYNCGCDPEAKWKCRVYPDCTYGKQCIDLVQTLFANGIKAGLEQEDDIQALPLFENVAIDQLTNRGPIEKNLIYEEPMSELTDAGAGYENNGGPDSLTLNDYQRSLHTYKNRHQECHALGLVGELSEVVQELKKDPKWLSVDRDFIAEVLIAAGNVADMVKKATAHGVPLNREHLKKELGDVLWYIAAVASDNSLTLQDIAEANVAKLRARYPKGWVKGGGVREACVKAPDGWACTRESGHDGPCAAVRTLPAARTAGAVYFRCGCSELIVDGVPVRTYCPDGTCRRLPR